MYTQARLVIVLFTVRAYNSVVSRRGSLMTQTTTRYLENSRSNWNALAYQECDWYFLYVRDAAGDTICSAACDTYEAMDAIWRDYCAFVRASGCVPGFNG